jgi:hypothetical protein
MMPSSDSVVRFYETGSKQDAKSLQVQGPTISFPSLSAG